jgi:aryl-alcohol dehydrogenase-like predicted oxidoreductase
MSAFAELIREGKVRAIGASNFTAPRLAEALATSARLGLPRYETLQPLFNLADRAPYEAELQKLCVAEGLGVINFFGLAHGFLTGKYRSEADLGQSPRGVSVKAYLDARGFRILAALDAAAARHSATPSQVALAWQMEQPGIVAPIASARSLAQLNELLGAARLALTLPTSRNWTAPAPEVSSRERAFDRGTQSRFELSSRDGSRGLRVSRSETCDRAEYGA